MANYRTILSRFSLRGAQLPIFATFIHSTLMECRSCYIDTKNVFPLRLLGFRPFFKAMQGVHYLFEYADSFLILLAGFSLFLAITLWMKVFRLTSFSARFTAIWHFIILAEIAPPRIKVLAVFLYYAAVTAPPNMMMMGWWAIYFHFATAAYRHNIALRYKLLIDSLMRLISILPSFLYAITDMCAGRYYIYSLTFHIRCSRYSSASAVPSLHHIFTTYDDTHTNFSCVRLSSFPRLYCMPQNADDAHSIAFTSRSYTITGPLCIILLLRYFRWGWWWLSMLPLPLSPTSFITIFDITMRLSLLMMLRIYAIIDDFWYI